MVDVRFERGVELDTGCACGTHLDSHRERERDALVQARVVNVTQFAVEVRCASPTSVNRKGHSPLAIQSMAKSPKGGDAKSPV
jgi:hypothetical protein